MEEPKDPNPATLEYAKPERASGLGFLLWGCAWSVLYILVVGIGVNVLYNHIRRSSPLWDVAAWVILYVVAPLYSLVDWLWSIAGAGPRWFGVVSGITGMVNMFGYGFGFAYLIRRIRRWRGRG